MALTAHNSALTDEQIPIFLANPPVQAPKWSLITPPAPATPGFPLLHPSTFSLIRSSCGYFHPT
ncbi:Male sterility, NAD-binding protein [Salix suchowensis]|nr:Male sterility, NAD-binding protein [Salix suchowensis]